MIVSRSNFDEIVERICHHSRLALDCETTGLRPYHGDRLFSIAIAIEGESFYFNFKEYDGLDDEFVLGFSHKYALSQALNRLPRTYYMHNAKFDLAMLAQEGIFLDGTIHCTMQLGRIVYNEHLNYDLASSAERIGFKKDDAVEEYIQEHALWEWVQVPGKKARKKNKFYDRVPFDIISKYAERDAEITYRLGESQSQTLREIELETPEHLPSLSDIADIEKELTRTVFDMERTGLKINRDYCVSAASYESGRAEGATVLFETLTGKPFAASPKLFAEVFESERDKWELTDKGNPCFESDVLAKFANPAAKAVLEFRDAKSRSDFYNGFIYHADHNDVVHPNLNPGGTGTGRFSSSDPNFQNLTAEEDGGDNPFQVRRAIVAPDGYRLVSLDYQAMEYRMMLDKACIREKTLIPLAEKVLNGHDVHQATADLGGGGITRKQAKMVNFLTLYGGGNGKLAEGLGVSLEEAKRIRTAIFSAIPEVRRFIDAVTRTAETRGFIRGFTGRRWYFPDKNFSYKAVNYLIQGSCADVMKIALNQIAEFLKPYKSRLILTIHDEVVLKVYAPEMEFVPQAVAAIMVNAYPHEYLPMAVEAAVGDNLADLETLDLIEVKARA